MHKNNSVYREMHKSHTRQENRPVIFRAPQNIGVQRERKI